MPNGSIPPILPIWNPSLHEHALAKHMLVPDIEIRRMMGRVRQDVLTATNNQQVPWVNEAIVGDLFLAR